MPHSTLSSWCRSVILPWVCTGWLGYAALAQTETNINGWYHYAGSYKVSPHWSILTDGQYRRSDGFARYMLQGLLRVALSYELLPGVQLSGGYVISTTYPYGNNPQTFYPLLEHRTQQQLQLSHKFGRLELVHRYRYEQRYQQVLDAQGGVQRYQFANRGRYQLRMNLPLAAVQTGQPYWYLSGGDEIFIRWGPTAGGQLFDQNRAFLYLGRNMGTIRLEGGYLHQLLGRRGVLDFESNHTLVVTFIHSISWVQQPNTEQVGN